MNIEQYISESERTCVKIDSMNLSANQYDTLHSAMGICTEAGELMDTVKKHLIYGTKLDRKNMFEELGDLMWYIALMCRAHKFDLEKIMDYNIQKLKVRYPEKFTSDDALNRDIDTEQSVFDDIEEEAQDGM